MPSYLPYEGAAGGCVASEEVEDRATPVYTWYVIIARWKKKRHSGAWTGRPAAYLFFFYANE